MNALEKTGQVLARTRNRAVLPVLSAGLRSQCAAIRAAAIRATIQRTDIDSHMQLIRCFAAFDESDRTVLAAAQRATPHHLVPAFKAALSSSDARLCDAACRIILLCRDFGSMPVLIKAVESSRNQHAKLLAETVLQLANMLHYAIKQWAVEANHAGHDPSFVRHQALAAFERVLDHGSHHLPSEVVEAFLLLAPIDNATLQGILNDSHHLRHAPLIEILSSSDEPSVFECLAAFVRDTDAPLAALKSIARRTDRPFVEYLLQTLKHPVPLRALHNMKRLRSMSWMETHREMLLDLDGRSQAVAIELALASALPPEALFDLLVLLLREGLAEARRAACQALSKFSVPQADMLVLAALDDPDAGVQAAAARQLRPRRVPDALRLLVEFLDSSSVEVRDAARSSLAEFNFIRFRAMFDLLDEQALRTTGMLVRKVDDNAIDGLLEELTSPSVSTRLRGIEMAVAMQATQDVCDQLVELANHENVSVRTEALGALAFCRGERVVAVLELAAGDKNHSIAETAQKSLACQRLATPAGEPS